VNASWYDLLDVAPDASDAEIRTAWRARVADLDPTDRTFRVYNQAAEVLLDPQRRAAYDAQQQAEQEAEWAAAERPADRSIAAEPIAAEPIAAEPTGATPGGATAIEHPPATSSPRWVVPTWLLAAVAALTAVAVAASLFIATTRPSDAAVRESTRAAQSAAERAIGPVLSYDYRRLDQDEKAAESYMTASYRRKYDQLFEVIKENAPRTRTVVTTEVADSGVIRAGEDRVDVLIFVNRPTTNKQTRRPQVYKDQVTARMQKVGNDWLVDCLLTSTSNDCA
jgi:Mce-associated membrane protein